MLTHTVNSENSVDAWVNTMQALMSLQILRKCKKIMMNLEIKWTRSEMCVLVWRTQEFPNALFV